ncbi:MAG TPA: APC family permease [Bryobacteraceae bacterium]|jgi:amino acid transporter|nr:APC family permease [Bryobacteraceae bacterium]
MSTPVGPAPEPAARPRRELRLRDLIFFNICAIISLRWVAAAAHAGSGSFLLWIVAALFFFLPSALVIARLSERFPEQGSMYIWTKQAFGDRHAFLCAWSYFVSNIFYPPSLLMAGVGMTAYVFGASGQRFAEERAFALPATLMVLWIAFLSNFFGLKIAKWLWALGGSSTFIIGGVLCAMAAVAGVRFGSVTGHWDLLPHPSLDTLNFWSQIAFAFVGLELAPIVSGEIRNPRRDLPRAAVISGIGCTLFYIVCTAALLVLLKPEQISPMTGLAQTAAAGAAKLGVPFVAVALAAMLGLAVAGQVDAWIAGNTRLPYVIGLDHYLPPAFARLHKRWRTPYVSLLVQVIGATLFLMMAQLGETVRAAYQIMVDMTVIATFIPFVYIFGAGFRFANRMASFSGLAVTLIAIALCFLPPPETASAPIFEAKVLGGTVLLAALGWAIFERYRAQRVIAADCATIPDAP